MTHDHSHSHHHHDHHDHHHHHGGLGHSHAPSHFGKAFAIGAALNIVYVVLEAVAGSLSGSLALLADAGHNLSDVLGLLLAWAAAYLSAQPPKGNRTYGFKRAPILASLANAVILLVAVGAIMVEAVRRMMMPEPVSGETIIWVAAIGVLVNAGTALLFMRGSKDDLNVRGAFLHMVADAAVTVGVIIAAILIGWTGWVWLDPVISFVIAAIILVSTWGLLKNSALLAIDAVPPEVDLDAVRAKLLGLPGVTEIHDLHVWALSTTEKALTCHLVMPQNYPGDDFLRKAADSVASSFGIGHATFQVETDTVVNCRLAKEDVV